MVSEPAILIVVGVAPIKLMPQERKTNWEINAKTGKKAATEEPSQSLGAADWSNGRKNSKEGGWLGLLYTISLNDWITTYGDS